MNNLKIIKTENGKHKYIFWLACINPKGNAALSINEAKSF